MKDLWKYPRALRRRIARWNPVRLLRHGLHSTANLRRRRARLDYILLTLLASPPTLPEPRDWLRARLLGPAPFSLLELDRLLRQIADDPRPKGIILTLPGLALPLAPLQTLRESLLRLRASGKRIICFAQNYGLADYFIASAADEIVLQPGGELTTLGLRREVVYLRDALARLGVTLDVVAISPFKSAFENLSLSQMSPEARAQFDWLLDSQYDLILTGIAEGRRMTLEAARQMIDGAPHLDEAALQAGYIDVIETEEVLHRRLNTAHIVPAAVARKRLLRKWRPVAEKYIAVLRISGLMVPGDSASPPVDLPIPFIGGDRVGDRTVVAQVRRVMKDPSAAAVLLYIDSGGGSANAAEAMTAALQELAATRPLVAYMDSVAASGGYYVATPAHWMVAQPGTITGSIGVITAKPITSGLYQQFSANRIELTRGANAALYSDLAPFSDAQRTQIQASIQRVYDLFVDHVARSRQRTKEAVDAVGGGRVWTGVQAQNHGLVDELGDVHAALAHLRREAALPDDTPVVLVTGKGKPMPAQLADRANPAAALTYLHDGLRLMTSGSIQALLPIQWEDPIP